MKKLPKRNKEEIPHIKVRFITDWECPTPRVFAGDEHTLPIKIIERKCK